MPRLAFLFGSLFSWTPPSSVYALPSHSSSWTHFMSAGVGHWAQVQSSLSSTSQNRVQSPPVTHHPQLRRPQWRQNQSGVAVAPRSGGGTGWGPTSSRRRRRRSRCSRRSSPSPSPQIHTPQAKLVWRKHTEFTARRRPKGSSGAHPKPAPLRVHRLPPGSSRRTHTYALRRARAIRPQWRALPPRPGAAPRHAELEWGGCGAPRPSEVQEPK